MANTRVTFHRLIQNNEPQPQYYVMKLGLYHDIIVEVVDGIPSDNIREYIHHYIPDNHIAIRELGAIKDSPNRIVLVYDKENTAPINPMATKLVEMGQLCKVSDNNGESVEITVTDRAFICLATAPSYTLQGLPERVKDDLIRALKKIFEPQRELDFTTGRTVRKLTLGSPLMERVFCNIIKQVGHNDVALHVEYDYINKDRSHVVYYRSSKGLYLIECAQMPKTNQIEVTMFRRVKVLHQAFDQEALKKMEFMEALGILNGRFVNKRVAMGKALEGVVKKYLQDTGYEYKKANPEDPDWQNDYVSVLPYKDNYYASIWLVDDTQVHIDIEVKKKIVHMKVYEELLKKEYEAR